MRDDLTPEVWRKVSEVMDRVEAEGGDDLDQMIAATKEVPEAFTPLPSQDFDIEVYETSAPSKDD